MPNDHRTPREIERDIEAERARLASTVDELHDRFSPETIIREIGRGFSEHGGDLGRSIQRSVKQNPVALTLTGIGLAWMIFGRSWDDQPEREPRLRHRSRYHDDHYDFDDDDFEDHDPITSASASPRVGYTESRTSEGSFGWDERRSHVGRRTHLAHRNEYRRGRHERSDWAYADLDHGWDESIEGSDEDETLAARSADAASRLADGASSTASDAADATRSAGRRTVASAQSAAASVAQTVRMAGHSAGRGVSDAASGASSIVSSMRESLAKGTEDMSEAARERVIDARARFIDARRRADQAARYYASRGSDKAETFIQEQPLVAGALAMAVGAALAGGLPRTRREDALFGEQRDTLFDEAERIFRREREKLKHVANAAADEARNVADEHARNADRAIETAADDVRDAAERVASHTKAEAEKQDLGKTDK